MVLKEIDSSIHWKKSSSRNVSRYIVLFLYYFYPIIIKVHFHMLLRSTTYETPLVRTRCIILRQSYIHLTQEGVLRSVKCVNIYERVYTLNFASISHISNLIVAIHFYSPLMYKPFKLSLNRYFSSVNDFTWRW